MLPSVESGLARYRLIRLLGRGGLGEVYLAHDSSLNRQVAIKFVAPERLGNEDGRRRLLHEARTTAALDHASICTVYEAGEAPDGRAFIAMQYIEGEPLSAVLQRGPMRPRDALALCSHIADGLAAAHRKGIVHRDLKPANVMVTPSGLPKLVDFGIAKVIVAAAAFADVSTTTATIEGDHLVGTPAYMSPEQVLQEPLDGRSDLFSLGAVLFECLTGRRAFSGRTAHDTTGQILNVYPPAPSSLQPAVTAEEDELCRRLLAKHPADRFQSADEVVGAIRLLLHDTSRMADTPRRPGRADGVPWVAIAAIVAMASAWRAVMWKRPDAAGCAARRTAVVPQSGTEAIREGAYASGRKQLLQAVGVYPQYAPRVRATRGSGCRTGRRTRGKGSPAAALEAQSRRGWTAGGRAVAARRGARPGHAGCRRQRSAVWTTPGKEPRRSRGVARSRTGPGNSRPPVRGAGARTKARSRATASTPRRMCGSERCMVRRIAARGGPGRVPGGRAVVPCRDPTSRGRRKCCSAAARWPRSESRRRRARISSARSHWRAMPRISTRKCGRGLP